MPDEPKPPEEESESEEERYEYVPLSPELEALLENDPHLDTHVIEFPTIQYGVRLPAPPGEEGKLLSKKIKTRYRPGLNLHNKSRWN